MAIHRHFIDFTVIPRLFIGDLAADALMAEFKSHGVLHPCCIVPKEASKRKVATHLLRHVAASSPVVLIKEPVTLDETALQDIIRQYAENNCDGIIACGGNSVQSVAKAVNIQVCGKPPDGGSDRERTPVRMVKRHMGAPLAAILFGGTDGNGMEQTGASPLLIAIDPRFTGISEETEVSSSTVTALLQLITSFQHVDDLLMESWIATSCLFLQRALLTWISTSHHEKELDGYLLGRHCGDNA